MLIFFLVGLGRNKHIWTYNLGISQYSEIKETSIDINYAPTIIVLSIFSPF